ncbi:MAG TPA: lyase family protein, partial [Clostridia bacterium]|nr:lyase family protein [Clostridia bacterium]
MQNDKYSNPLSERYASAEMLKIFSEQHRIGLWRRLWLALAECQKELGLPITEEQLAEIRANLDNIDFEAAAAREAEVRHDVMAHIYTLGLACPAAKPIIHLGATSCFVTDNSELIQMHEGLTILSARLKAVIKNLAALALKYKDLPALGLTHYQAAQLTTVGKRFTLYIQDFMLDLENLASVLEGYRLRGAKGTTGTQASFLELFSGDYEKVKALDKAVAKKMGFPRVFDVSGQTYTRKFDYFVLSALSGIAQSASKFATDLRLLQSRKEMEEPFGKNQVGSSAMAYKRNPMMS